MRKSRPATTPFVPTPPTNEATERLSPDADIASYGWSYTFSKFLGDAATGDGVWNDHAHPGAGQTRWVRFSMPTPSGQLTGTQTFRVRAKTSATTGTPKVAVRVFENGVERAAPAAQNLTTSWATYTWTWNANILSDLSGAGVELRLEHRDGTSGQGHSSFDAVDWIARYQTSAPTTETWPEGWGARPALGLHHGISQPFVDDAREQFNSWLGRPMNVALVFAPLVATWDELAGGAGDADTTWLGQLAAAGVTRAFEASIWPVDQPLLFAMQTLPTSHENRWNAERGIWTNPTIWASIASGTFDLYYTRLFRRLARRCAQLQRAARTVVIVPAAEANHRDVTHAVGPNVADFISAWQKIVTLAHDAAQAILGTGQKFKIGFLLSQHLYFGSGSVRLSNLYPGDAYVDHLGMIVRDYWGVANSTNWNAILDYPVTLGSDTFEGVRSWLDFCQTKPGKWLGMHCRTNYTSIPSYPRTTSPEAWWAGIDDLRARYDGRLAWLTHMWTADTRLDRLDGWGEPYRRRYGVARTGELPTPLRTIQVTNTTGLTSALANAQPGDHIVLADGTYNLSGRMQLTQSGTAQNPIVIRAQNVLGAKLPGGFEYAAGTSHVWLWGIDFKDAVGCPLRGQHHKIRRCRFWPKPNYAANGWAVAVTPYSGSDGEISYCELRMHTREEALAENSNLWGSNTVYGVVWSYFSGSNAPFYRLKIARCLLTGGPKDVPYHQPNCQFIEASTTPSNGYETNCDWTIQDCYGDSPRNSTILDFKCRGMKLIRSHIVCPTNGTFQFREGRDHRIERCRLGGYIEITRGPGNVIANTIAHDIAVMAGILPYNQFGNNSGDQGQAYRAVIANCTSSMTVGKKYSGSFTHPALETLIEQHTGTISYDLHSQTTVRPTLQASGVTPASPVTMTAGEVGPNAPWVGID